MAKKTTNNKKTTTPKAGGSKVSGNTKRVSDAGRGYE